MHLYSVNGTNASYSPLQGWSNTKRYAFFAYYPLDKVSLVNLDGSKYTGGVPAIKYTMALSDPKGSMADVMRATPMKDLDGSSSDVTNNDVLLSFNHCLSCLEVKMQNAPEGSTITINSVDAVLANIKHTEATIPLDPSYDKDHKVYGGSSIDSKEYSFTLADTDKSIASSGTVELSDKPILIPQEDELTVKLVISYTRSAEDYGFQTATVTTPVLTTALKEGKKHIINLRFTDSTVDVVGEVSEEGWVVIPEVDNSFN